MNLRYDNFSDKILNEAISWFWLYRPPPIHNFIKYVSNQKKPEVKNFLKFEDIFESIVYEDIIMGFFYSQKSISRKRTYFLFGGQTKNE